MSEASELLVEVTDSCCTVLLLYCSLLHYKSVMSGFLNTWVGLFSGERFLKNMPTPLSELPLKFITHRRIFESLLYLHYPRFTNNSWLCLVNSLPAI